MSPVQSPQKESIEQESPFQEAPMPTATPEPISHSTSSKHLARKSSINEPPKYMAPIHNPKNRNSEVATTPVKATKPKTVAKKVASNAVKQSKHVNSIQDRGTEVASSRLSIMETSGPRSMSKVPQIMDILD